MIALCILIYCLLGVPALCIDNKKGHDITVGNLFLYIMTGPLLFCCVLHDYVFTITLIKGKK